MEIIRVYVRERKKTQKHKQICGIVPGLRGCQHFIYVFFGVIPYGGEKHINKIPPIISGQSRETSVYVCFSSCVFFSRSLLRIAARLRLYQDLRRYVCHDAGLPLTFDPAKVKADIPPDAAWYCEMAHKFKAEQYLTDDVLSKIELSLQAGKLHEILCKKMAGVHAQGVIRGENPSEQGSWKGFRKSALRRALRIRGGKSTRQKSIQTKKYI